MSTADFLNVTGHVMFWAGVAGLANELGLYVPGDKREQAVPAFEPGWLERRQPDRPQFISDGEDLSPGKHKVDTISKLGHKEYLRYMVTHDDLLIDILHDAYTDLMKPHDHRPHVTEVFRQHVKYAADRLIPLGGTVTDAAHAAFFTMAAVYSDLFNRKDILEYFDVSIPLADGDQDDTYWHLKFVDHMPVVFATDHGKESGVDKVMHFANFAFVLREYWYADYYGLAEAERVPVAATIVANAGLGDARKKADIFTLLAGFVWEGYETTAWFNDVSKGKIVWPTSDGYLDPDVWGDLDADKLGRMFALRLAKINFSREYVNKTVREFFHPEELLKEYDVKAFPMPF